MEGHKAGTLSWVVRTGRGAILSDREREAEESVMTLTGGQRAPWPRGGAWSDAAPGRGMLAAPRWKGQGQAPLRPPGAHSPVNAGASAR